MSLSIKNSIEKQEPCSMSSKLFGLVFVVGQTSVLEVSHNGGHPGVCCLDDGCFFLFNARVSLILNRYDAKEFRIFGTRKSG